MYFLVIFILAMVYGGRHVDASIPLTRSQQTHIRHLLSNPETPVLIRLKTKNIVFDKYRSWAHYECRTILNKHGCRHAPDELFEYASLGLLNAIHRYNWTRPTSFTQYAKKYVLGSVYRGMNVLYRTRNQMMFVDNTASWIFDKYGAKSVTDVSRQPSASSQTFSWIDLVNSLTADERQLFLYVYGHLLDGSDKRSVNHICQLMAYGNKESFRIRKTRMDDHLRGFVEADKDTYLQ